MPRHLRMVFPPRQIYLNACYFRLLCRLANKNLWLEQVGSRSGAENGSRYRELTYDAQIQRFVGNNIMRDILASKGETSGIVLLAGRANFNRIW